MSLALRMCFWINRVRVYMCVSVVYEIYYIIKGERLFDDLFEISESSVLRFCAFTKRDPNFYLGRSSPDSLTYVERPYKRKTKKRMMGK